MNLPPARKRFGQHFLVDPAVVEKIIHTFAPRKEQTIVEIGPGHGALTGHLINACGVIHAIEIDRDLTLQLKVNFGDRLNLHCQDVLKFDFTSLANDNKPVRIVGNLPYNISTPLLFHLFKQRAAISDMAFMLQKEVVDRLTAGPGGKNYGRLSVMCAYYCRAEKLFDVPPHSFKPPPKIDSSVVSIVPHQTSPFEVVDAERFTAVVKQAFGQRRKTLRNIFKNDIGSEEIKYAGIDPGLRPERLSVAEFIKIANLSD